MARRAPEALPDLQRAAAAAPEDPETQRRLAMALAALGRADEARAAWEKAVRLDRSHQAPQTGLPQLGEPAPK